MTISEQYQYLNGVDKMTNEQIKLLAQMLKNGQAKLVEQKDGKLVPVSLI